MSANKTKILECKMCGDEVAVPENRASAVCLKCANEPWEMEEVLRVIEDCTSKLERWESDPVREFYPYGPGYAEAYSALRKRLLVDTTNQLQRAQTRLASLEKQIQSKATGGDKQCK